MNTVHIKSYDLFRKELNLSDEKAKAFVEAINDVVSEDIKQERPAFKSWFKDDFQNSSNQINDGRKESSNLKNDINRLDVKISETKTDIVHWMLAFWLGQIAIIIGVLMYFPRK